MHEIPHNHYIPLFLGLNMYFPLGGKLTVTFMICSAEFTEIIKEGFQKATSVRSLKGYIGFME